ncbi:hypothetical protein [Cupriavidus gilardii]|uniref:hypothetical protein n=1 Tax=Cupriavidus gilardii TaxID=82541 RepID=UPI001580A9E9|nr:hypothetical protein [Cupriavidus gilardii]QKS60880.1 hypothetical protein FOB47_02630 [Cupriavidus gilardii]
MTNDHVREAFEARDAWMAEIKAMGHPPPSVAERACFIDGFARGRAAGMERAAGICDQNSKQWDTPANGTAAYAAGRCAEAIRAEIKGADHEG